LFRVHQFGARLRLTAQAAIPRDCASQRPRGGVDDLVDKDRGVRSRRRDGANLMSTQGWVCALIMTTTTVAGTKESLSMQVSPAMSFAPANLMIRAKVEPDAANREMEVIAQSDDFYRSSAIQLEGDRAPRTVTFEFRSLPSGEYQVTAVVVGIDGQQRALARSSVHVIESGASR